MVFSLDFGRFSLIPPIPFFFLFLMLLDEIQVDFDGRSSGLSPSDS